jgi:hypothetical protein
MAEPLSKKRKKNELGDSSNADSNITDPRFSNIQSDPRYRLPNKRRAHHVKVDKRFSHMLRDDDFARKAKIDRYGRPLEGDSERKRLKRRYEFEDGIDDDKEVEEELERVENTYDPIRDGGYSETSSSSEESSSEDDLADEDGRDGVSAVGIQDADDVPVGEISSRIAVVNLDWDNIRAEDLMAVFSSFLPPGGRMTKVSIYPSQFGKERMEREEMEGPPKEIFGPVRDQKTIPVGADDQDDDQQIKDSILNADDGDDFDPAGLRKYQLQRLQYFYAILEFSSSSVAKAVYDAVDGTEYQTTANFFDLRFVPEETDFSADKQRDDCKEIPDGYRPNDFVTDALQHSNVKLTWDGDDVSRKEAQARAFSGSRKDIEENDLKAYLGSDSSSEEEPEALGEFDKGSVTKKEQARQKMRTLLGLGAESKKVEKKDLGPVGDLQITFSSGLSEANGTEKKSVFENEPDLHETTVEKYVRKERERKQKRKQRVKDTAGPISGEATDGNAGVKDVSREQQEDLGFDDPFFAGAENDQKSSARVRKEERLQKRAKREAEESAAAAKRAELELLMVDDRDDGKEMRHFDMKEIERGEKKPRKEKKKRKGKKGGNVEMEPQQSGFKMDTQDPRFAKVYESHEYAIDPTNPRFKATEGMKALLEEGRTQRKQDRLLEDGELAKSLIASRKPESTGHRRRDDDVRGLIEKVKSKKIE